VATVAGYGFRPYSINKLTKLVPADGSRRSIANVAMLTCEDFGNGAGLGNFAAGRYISHMPKRKRETEWEVIASRRRLPPFVGLVQAPDKATALKTAIKQFNIRREDQSRLLIRPR
jgi:hypothetical protein